MVTFVQLNHSPLFVRKVRKVNSIIHLGNSELVEIAIKDAMVWC